MFSVSAFFPALFFCFVEPTLFQPVTFTWSWTKIISPIGFHSKSIILNMPWQFVHYRFGGLCRKRSHYHGAPPSAPLPIFPCLIISAGSPKLRLLIHDTVFFIYQIPPAKGSLIFPSLPTKVLIFFLLSHKYYRNCRWDGEWESNTKELREFGRNQVLKWQTGAWWYRLCHFKSPV